LCGGFAGASDEEGEGEGPEEALFRSTAPLVTRSTQKLQPGLIDMIRCRDANMQEPSKVCTGPKRMRPCQGATTFAVPCAHGVQIGKT
jgi:hypothetical protein